MVPVTCTCDKAGVIQTLCAGQEACHTTCGTTWMTSRSNRTADSCQQTRSCTCTICWLSSSRTYPIAPSAILTLLIRWSSSYPDFKMTCTHSVVC